jgi:hypothetical protein
VRACLIRLLRNQEALILLQINAIARPTDEFGPIVALEKLDARLHPNRVIDVSDETCLAEGGATMYATELSMPEIPWKPFTEFPGDAEVKTLRDEGPGKPRTLLIRLPANGKVESHSHVVNVQHYLLEGEYESEGKLWRAGTYRLLPGHADVADITTENGVTILMIYDPLP